MVNPGSTEAEKSQEVDSGICYNGRHTGTVKISVPTKWKRGKVHLYYNIYTIFGKNRIKKTVHFRTCLLSGCFFVVVIRSKKNFLIKKLFLIFFWSIINIFVTSHTANNYVCVVPTSLQSRVTTIVTKHSNKIHS